MVLDKSTIRICLLLLTLLLLAGCAPSGGNNLPTLAPAAELPPPPTPELDTDEDESSTDEPAGTAVAELVPTFTPNAVQPSESAEPQATTVPPTATSTETPVPTVTPTSLPQVAPTLIFGAGDEADSGSEVPIPTAVPPFDTPNDITNILLLGNDGGINTDTIMIASINRQGPTASIISIPRDLYVYMPGKQMGRVNTAVAIGGVDLLKQTILYNFGVPIHYYARIDFDGFKETVDILDGVEIAVSCRLQDWRLKSPTLNPEVEDNWEQFALEPGVYEMDGDLALWYVRSRKTTSDFDRGRRQQQLVHAMFNQGVDVGLVAEFPALWNTYKEYIETDMDIGRMLQLASLASAVRQNGIQHLYLAGKTEPFLTPSGAQVQLPVWEGERKMEEEFSRLYLPPALSTANRAPIFVEIINASGNPDAAVLAADNLAYHGFIPVFGFIDETAETVPTTTLSYYKPNFKGSYDWLISWIFDMRKSEIELAEDDDYEYDYRVVLGRDYNPCRPQMLAPQIFLDN